MTRFLMMLMLAACGEAPVSDTPPTVRPPVVVTPPPVPVLPAYDESLDSSEEVEAWRTEALAAIEAYAALPDPEKIEAGYAAKFKVTPESVAAQLGDPKQWEVGYKYPVPGPAQPTAKPTVAEAARLEGADEEYAAGLMYAALGDKAAVRRCIAALTEELEWAAVAQLALAIDDEAALAKALDIIQADGRDDSVRDTVRSAIEAGKHDRAVSLAEKYGVDLASDKLFEAIRDRALRGDARLLGPFAAAQLDRWSACVVSQSETTLTDIHVCGDHWTPSMEVVVLLAKSDKKKAFELARAYLTDPRANVVAWLHCGEGCGTDPVVGTLELYQLVKADPALKAAYLARVRGWGAAAFNDYPEWDEPTLGALMAKVRKTKDTELVKAWDDALGKPSGEAADVAGFLRTALGLPGAITPDPFRYGTISTADLKALWTEFGFPAAPATPRYASAQFKEALATADALDAAGKHDEADLVYVGLLRSGWKPGKLPRNNAFDPNGLSLALAEAGYPEQAREYMVRHIDDLVGVADAGRSGQEADLLRLLRRPESVRAANERADEARRGLEGPDAPRGIPPRDFAQVNDIVAPVAKALKAKAPVVYERFIVNLDAEGNSALYDAELASRNAAGDLAGVQRLTGVAAQ